MLKEPVHELLDELSALRCLLWRNALAFSKRQPSKVVDSQTLDESVYADRFVHLCLYENTRS